MQADSQTFSTPILWYRDFHDVPRLICVPVAGGVIVLDSPFSDELDEYTPSYTVKLVVIDHASAIDEDAVLQRLPGLDPIGHLPVSYDMFDQSRRRHVTIPRVIGTVSLAPPD